MFQKHEVQPEVKLIQTQVRSNAESEDIENLTTDLSVVCKDHNNVVIQDLIGDSHRFIYSKALAECFRDDDDPLIEELFSRAEAPFNHPTFQNREATHIFVVNETDFGPRLEKAVQSLRKDGMSLGILKPFCRDPEKVPVAVSHQPKSELSSLIDKIKNAMKTLDHVLYKGAVFAKPKNARYTYVFMHPVKKYLDLLLSSPILQDPLLKNLSQLEKIMSSDTCSVIEQVKFDLDLIEVSNGQLFKISERRFTDCSILTNDIGKTSPRMFVQYNCDFPPDPKYFQESIFNSFPDKQERVNFLNKFYQCLMAGRMPHKCPKLVVAGPKDSGKTTWLSVLTGVISPRYIATVTKEKQFSMQMISEDTQLVFIDEWSPDTLQSDAAKVTLQGGLMPVAKKNQQPDLIDNRAPFYITTNDVPYFGEDDENVRRRIRVFNTKSIKDDKLIKNVDQWCDVHAMDCIVWTANELNENIEIVDKDERWYENAPPVENIVTNEERALSKERRVLKVDVAKIKALTFAEIDSSSTSSVGTGEQTGVPMEVIPEQVKTAAKEHVESLKREQTRLMEIEEEYGIRLSPTCPESCKTNDLNNKAYFQRVYRQLFFEFDLDLNPQHALSFLRKKPEFDAKRGDNTEGNPAYDGWLMVLGRSREAFDQLEFFKMYLQAYEEILKLRKKCNVRVLRDMDPVYQAVREVKRAQNIPQSKKYREHDEGYEKPQSSNEEDTGQSQVFDPAPKSIVLRSTQIFSEAEETVLNSSEPESDEDGKEPSTKQDGLIGYIFKKFW